MCADVSTLLISGLSGRDCGNGVRVGSNGFVSPSTELSGTAGDTIGQSDCQRQLFGSVLLLGRSDRRNRKMKPNDQRGVGQEWYVCGDFERISGKRL